ncbi:MAG TPA: hypothetical protein VE986_00950 [Hyphomicrobiales bacterium]|nr:hypothetical protein [Hyphomicrobiales bacterium]
MAATLPLLPFLYLGAQGERTLGPAEENVTYKAKTAFAMPKFKKTMTTIFWVGEVANRSNGYIANYASYWDPHWLKHYGGVDSPDDRKGYLPAAFTPRQNPFYVALPFAETDEEGNLKEIAKKIPGYGTGKPLTRNRWVEIRYRGRSCYAQWQDVGPYEEDDFDWVFGDAPKPKNTRGLKAGLDISPAAAQYLGMNDSDRTEWRFVDAKEVPDGPWKEIVTK